MQETKQDKKVEKTKIDDNIIFIGTKPLMNYVTAVVMQITTKDADEVKILARGQFISRAVDVVEVARNRFLDGKNKVKIEHIEIGSEQYLGLDGNQWDILGKKQKIE